MRRIVALYENLPDVEPVIRDLVAAGISRSGVTVIANIDEHQAFRRSRSAAQSGEPPAAVPAAGPDSRARNDQDFLGWLFGGGTPPSDATAYHRGVESGGRLISIDADDALHDRAMAILEQYGAVDINERGLRDEPVTAGAGEGIVAGGTAATPAPTEASARPDVGKGGIATSDHAGGLAGSAGSFGSGTAPVRGEAGSSTVGSRRVRSYAVDGPAGSQAAAAASDSAMAGNKPGAVTGLASEEIDGGASRRGGPR
jgi:hypothetical protein